MRLITEALDKKQQILIVEREKTLFRNLVKKKLESFGAAVYVSPLLPGATSKFDFVFFINDDNQLKSLRENPPKRFVFVFIKKNHRDHYFKKYLRQKHLHNVKVVFLSLDDADDDELERIIWFSLSKSKERVLHINRLNIVEPYKKTARTIPWKISISKKGFLIGFLSFFVLYFIVLNILLSLGTLFYVRSLKHIKTSDLERARKSSMIAGSFSKTGKKLFMPMRGVYFLFSVGFISDRIANLNERLDLTAKTSLNIAENSSRILALISKRQKNQAEKQLLHARFKKLEYNIDQFVNSARVLYGKIPDYPDIFKSLKNELRQASDLGRKLGIVVPLFDKLLAQNTEKKYLLIILDNSRLLPGGGIVKAYGTTTIKDYDIEIPVFYKSAYADINLTARIDPPDFAKQYIDRPYVLVETSMLSSDLFKNYNRVKTLLQNAKNNTDFAGIILITTTGLREISKGGESFEQILTNLPNTSPYLFAQRIKEGFDMKHVAILVENSAVQSSLDKLYWSGKTIAPRCVVKTQNCIVDYLFPIQVNALKQPIKLPQFIKQQISYRVRIDKDGHLISTLTVNLKNNSSDLLKKTYPLFLQFLIPSDVSIEQITKNGVLIDDALTEKKDFTYIGIPIDVEPQKDQEILITYGSGQQLKKGRGIYQLILQKQIGASESDITLELISASNISIVNQNFSPIVKGGRIFYNTSLTADKIFFIELLKN